MVAPATGREKAEISVFSRSKRVFDAFRWDERHRTLVAQPVFSTCSRNDVRRLLRAGDEIVVEPGEVLLHEDAIGYWFFVVLAGSVELSRAGRPIATLGPSSHVGDIAILGFGPQPATVTALERARFFVLGRRELLNLSSTMDSFQRGLFPGAGANAFTLKVRELRSDAAAAWRALPSREPEPVADLPAPSFRWTRPSQRGDQPFRARSLLPAAIALPQAVSTRLSPRARVVTAAAIVATVVLAALLYHPPVLVVRPERAIDAVADIDVRGVATRRPTGAYLILAVDITKPNAIGALWAYASGDRIVPDEGLPDGVSDATAQQNGRDVFRASERSAIATAARHVGMDPARLDVRIRDRGITGPSAGLVYTLALIDMLGGRDLAQHRRIAATGALESNGVVSAVGFVEVKERAADEAGAALFLVPRGEATGHAHTHTVAIDTVDQAIAALLEPQR